MEEQLKLNYYTEKFSKRFIIENAEKLDWELVTMYQKLSEPMIELYFDKVDWFWISLRYKLSDAFINRNVNNLNWRALIINKHTKLKTIIKYANRFTRKDFLKRLSKKNLTLHQQVLVDNFITRKMNIFRILISK